MIFVMVGCAQHSAVEQPANVEPATDKAPSGKSPSKKPSSRVQAPKAVIPSLPKTLPASFSGTLQCQYCPAVPTRLLLLADGTFFFTQTTKDEDGLSRQDDIGHWVFDAKARRLSLLGRREQPLLLTVDKQGELAPADGPEQGGVLIGKLLRDPSLQPISPQLYMQVLYDSGAEEVKECRTGRGFQLARPDALVELATIEPSALSPQRLLVGLEGKLIYQATDNTNDWQLTDVNVVKAWPNSSCATPKQDAQLRGTYWRIVLLNNKVVYPEQGQEPYLIFKNGGELTGKIGCSKVSGLAISEQQDIRFGEVRLQLGNCADESGQQQYLFDALNRTTSYHIDGQNLELLAINGEVLVHLEAIYLH